ncbi:MAG TPA: N-acetylmuramoyl-L-alanine amidase, partial [Elusimicrobiota bacterium]|nr:N-acetylmuramoyl-L-alanine amidase [Elusimicrobiota bacterium]
SGLYEGAYRVGPSDSFSSAEIVVALKRERRVVTRAAAHGRLSTPQTPPGVAWVRGGTTYIRSAPESGFILFPAPGTRLLTTARVEGWAKVELTPSLSGWIEEKSLERLPAGTPPPAAVVGTIRAAAAPGSTVISLDLSQQVPYEVEESPDLDRVTLRLYYSAGHTNWVIYDDQDDFLRQVRWEQRGSDVVEVTADLRPGRRLWGYDVSYKERSLRLELRHPPAIAPKPRSALSGRVIIVDPGHSPSSPGAIGPHRTLEMDVNYALAKELEALLSAEGAQPVVTRSSPADEVTLGERMRLAWSRRGDAFVSVHNNALADGENPFDRPHGYSVFFYHPHSLALARATHQAYGRDALLPSEGLRYGNLMVARATQMPSILTESAYLMYPDQEDLLLTPAKRREFARAMLEGLRRFFEAERERQAAAGWPPPPPAPRAKAKTAPGPKQGAAPRTGAARAQPKKNTKRP